MVVWLVGQPRGIDRTGLARTMTGSWGCAGLEVYAVEVVVLDVVEGLGDATGGGVVGEAEVFEVCEVGQLGGDDAGEGIVSEVEASQLCEIAEFGGYRAWQLVMHEVEPFEVSEFGRNCAVELVAVEEKVAQIGKGSELRR